jgi:hypothetical protein
MSYLAYVSVGALLVFFCRTPAFDHVASFFTWLVAGIALAGIRIETAERAMSNTATRKLPAASAAR